MWVYKGVTSPKVPKLRSQKTHLPTEVEIPHVVTKESTSANTLLSRGVQTKILYSTAGGGGHLVLTLLCLEHCVVFGRRVESNTETV